MKKLKWGLAACACTWVLTACGEDETEENAGAEQTEETEETDTDSETSEAEEEELSVEEIITKSTDAMNDVNGYHMEGKMEQTITAGEEEMPMDLELSADISEDPYKIHQDINAPNPMGAGSMSMEQYLDEEGTLYMYMAEEDQWLKAGEDFTGIDQLTQTTGVSTEEQLELIKQSTENISVEEEEDRYVLSVDGSGDDLLEIGKEFATMGTNTEAQAGEVEQMMEAMNIETLNYVVSINKDTFFTEDMDIDIDMEVEEGGETMSFSQSASFTLSQFNDIDDIEVPQEAVDNALDMSELEGTGTLE
ncbi:DUF6612 family protein [Salibacterium lacus]|uniref:DUF6612 family protein n=1 Tax=Salibacterium lacus TaxID=1898109 RepID=A0ABW5T4B8_9BACI